MVAYVYRPLPTFEKILADARNQKRELEMSKKSIVWLQNYAKREKDLPQNFVNQARTQSATRLKNARQLELGSLYLFVYDAKYKETLPYWDRYPLVMPFDSNRTEGRAASSAGFMGLNFHYIHPNVRAAVFDGLAKVNADKKDWDENTRFKANYLALKTMSQHPLVMPCVKKYLLSHVKNQGRFIYIDPREWQMALFLPLQRFFENEKPISAQKVWAESAKKARRRKI